jgi:UDP-perosamine 4-acetyltransferase
MDNLVVIGGGGHAKVLVSVLRKLHWDVLGYTDERDNGTIRGLERLGDDTALQSLLEAHTGCAAVVGVGKVDTSPLRIRLQDLAEDLGFEIPVIVSPDATVNTDVALSAGTAIFDGAVVNSGARIGKACIINTNSTLEHDCCLGDNVHVASGATVCGEVSAGHNTLIGAGATVIQGVRICDACVVGAGAVVTSDLEEPGTYVGAPARRLR